MNILICSFSFPPRPGGVSQVTRAHARGLVQRGHEVTVATEDVSDQHGIDFPADFKVLQFKVSGNANPRSRYDGDIDEYLSFIGSFTGDLICCHCWQTWSTDLAIKAFSKTRSRKILVSHGVSANTKLGWPRAFPTWLLWRPYVLWEMPTILKAFDHLILLSDRSDKDRFYDRYMADRMGYRNISVIPNGVDLHAHDKAPSDFRVRYGIDTQRLVLCVGSYYDLKNQKMALEAFISANPADTTLVFIGPSKNRYTLEIENRWAQTKKTLAGARMICLDSLSMETILSAYKTADLYLCSSRTECFPLAILDAMASKTPFISTDVGCIRDLPGGIVVNDQNEMAREIGILYKDEGRRKGLGEEGRAACESTYNWPRVIDAYETLFENILMNNN